MGFGVADVAGPAQIKDAHRVREWPCAAGAGRIAGLTFVRLLPGAGGVECLMLGLGPQGQATGVGLTGARVHGVRPGQASHAARANST